MPGTFDSGSDEPQAENIGMGIVNLIQTVNTGIRPDAKKTTEAPNPSLKPSEQIRLTPKSVGNIMGAARAISRAERGTGETIFGDESQSVEKQIDLGIAHYTKKRDELRKLFDSIKSIKTTFFFGLEELL